MTWQDDRLHLGEVIANRHPDVTDVNDDTEDRDELADVIDNWLLWRGT